MGNIFSKFFMSFGFNKNKYLPAGTEEIASFEPVNSANNAVAMAMRNAAKASNVSNASNTINTGKPAKTLASFDINIEKPKFEGAIPEATIKFYPLD